MLSEPVLVNIIEYSHCIILTHVVLKKERLCTKYCFLTVIELVTVMHMQVLYCSRAGCLYIRRTLYMVSLLTGLTSFMSLQITCHKNNDHADCD